ncbi:unnamed protein product [Allacma fusca]|uniref:C2H2-type domain-containing protein n=1 Tax=Allacma fusca TaxID=39272 RepID=A0A8J2KRG2_9HEXA|nr:unnamed protein product [Allacma fusca]
MSQGCARLYPGLEGVYKYPDSNMSNNPNPTQIRDDSAEATSGGDSRTFANIYGKSGSLTNYTVDPEFTIDGGTTLWSCFVDSSGPDDATSIEITASDKCQIFGLAENLPFGEESKGHPRILLKFDPETIPQPLLQTDFQGKVEPQPNEDTTEDPFELVTSNGTEAPPEIEPRICNENSFTELTATLPKKRGRKRKYYFCGYCSYKHSFKYVLLRHMFVHNTQVLYACQHCDFQTLRRTQLKEHLKSHEIIVRSRKSRKAVRGEIQEKLLPGKFNEGDAKPRDPYMLRKQRRTCSYIEESDVIHKF